MAQTRHPTRSRVSIALGIAFAGALAGLSTSADATAITAVGNVFPGTYVNSPISGSFNISSLLAGNSVQSGTVTASFTDNTDPLSYVGQSTTTSVTSNTYTVYYSYSCGNGCYYTEPYTYTDYYYTNDITNYYSDPLETALLSVGASSGSASSVYYNTDTFTGTAPGGSGWNGSGYTYVTYNYYNDTSGYDGSFSISLNLDSTALADLNSSGMLNFGITPTAGDFLVSGVTLSADLAPSTGAAAVSIPEPGSLALLGIALVAGVAVTRRSRKR